MFNITLRKDAKDGFAVRGIVDVGTGEKFVDNVFHLIIAEYLTIRNGGTLRKSESNSRVYCRELRVDRLIGDHLLDEGDRVKTFGADRDAINGIGIATQIAEIETDGRQVGQELLHGDSLRGRELHRLGEKYLLSASCMVLKLVHISLIANTDIGTILVDNHQTGLDGSHEVLSFVLVVVGRTLLVDH